MLSEYLVKLDTRSQPVDHDYNLPNEELTFPAVHPPVLSLELENYQGYHQPITIRASSGSPSTGVTVKDVLHGDVKKPRRKRQWTTSSARERAVIDIAFRERCDMEEELGQGHAGLTSAAGIGSNFYRNLHLTASCVLRRR